MGYPLIIAMNEITIAAICAIVGATLAFIFVKLLDRLRRKDAESEAHLIVEKARVDVSNRLKEAELKIKEDDIQQKAEFDRELSKNREQLRDRERLLDKRHEATEQQAEHLRKQERIVEATQRRLTEKISDTEQRNEELGKLLDLQRQTLHDLSGLNRDEATSRLLEMLEKDLKVV